MPRSTLLERYMEPLLAGDREACRKIVQDQLQKVESARPLYAKVIWPSMQRVDSLYRDDLINTAAEHMATRINRSIADQIQLSLGTNLKNGKSILVSCAEGEPEELGSQMCADLLEADGWKVTFIGGGVPNDEILILIGKLRPNILLIFGTQPSGVPQVRHLIDLIHEVSANPTMNIMLSGGVFNRAEGLWKEINADLFAANADDALKVANAAQPKEPIIRIPGAPKKRRRRRKPPLLASAE